MATLVTLDTRPLDRVVLEQKQDDLLNRLRSLGEVIVAYSGGTDSAYLAWAETHPRVSSPSV